MFGPARRPGANQAVRDGSDCNGGLGRARRSGTSGWIEPGGLIRFGPANRPGSYWAAEGVWARGRTGSSGKGGSGGRGRRKGRRRGDGRTAAAAARTVAADGNRADDAEVLSRFFAPRQIVNRFSVQIGLMSSLTPIFHSLFDWCSGFNS